MVRANLTTVKRRAGDRPVSRRPRRSSDQGARRNDYRAGVAGVERGLVPCRSGAMSGVRRSRRRPGIAGRRASSVWIAADAVGSGLGRGRSDGAALTEQQCDCRRDPAQGRQLERRSRPHRPDGDEIQDRGHDTGGDQLGEAQQDLVAELSRLGWAWRTRATVDDRVWVGQRRSRTVIRSLACPAGSG